MKKGISIVTSFLVLTFLCLSAKSSVAQEIQITPVIPEITSIAGNQAPAQFNLSTMPAAIQQQIQKKIKGLEQPVKSEQTVSEPIQSVSEPELPSSQVPVETKEDISDFEQFVTGKAPTTISMNIRQFGYDLFRKPPSTFTPSTNVPVGPEYVVGPGDEIRITIWGKIEGKWNVVVDRDGNISLPKVGVVGITGLTFMELKDVIHKEFSKYYTGFEMNVSMGALRTIRVYIVGNALSPGAYTISALSTLVNALFEAGGPNKTGSMRNIQVKRNGQAIVSFDMYDFLLKGDKTKDIRLMPEDVIFIPPVGPLAGIAGKVNAPAIYELKGETTITDLIEMAGGITATGYLQRVQFERIQDNEVKILVDTNIKELSKEKNISLQDRDIIKVFPISNVITNAIVLKGNITRPGQYQWFKGIRVSDILKEPAKDLLPETYYDHALIERYIPPDYHKEMISFNLARALFDNDESEDKLLRPFDTLTIYSKWEFREKPVVIISGAVNKPGTYELQPNMKLSDLVNLAGGVKRYAFVKEAELTRVNITQQGPETEQVIINLEKVLNLDPESNISLKSDDYLFVRTVPEWRLYQTVTIQGEVRFPGTYTIEKGQTLSSLINRAGGYSDEAFLRGAVFTRERVRKLQQENINTMIARLESELYSEGAAQISTAFSPEEIQAKKVEMEQQQAFIESLKKIRATGRMSIRLAHLRLLKGSEFDIELEEGDRLFIPMKNNVVNVLGSVMSRSSFIYSGKLKYQDYIDMAGGYSRHADKKNVYVLKVDGTAMRLSSGFLNWSSSSARWEIKGFAEDIKEIEPGDSIVVPEKLDRIAWMREIKDFTQILYQIAVTAAVVIRVL